MSPLLHINDGNRKKWAGQKTAFFNSTYTFSLGIIKICRNGIFCYCLQNKIRKGNGLASLFPSVKGFLSSQ